MSESRTPIWYEDLEADDWTSPTNMLKIKAAVAKGETTLTLGSRTFRIQYNDSDRVFIKCISSYAPCGWFSKEKLARYQPEGDFGK